MDFESNKYIQGIAKILDDIGEKVEGNFICDMTSGNYSYPRNLTKILNLQYLCKNKKKIIEIGVNACHSLVLMLIINPDAEYLLFDLNNHKYTEHTINYVKKSFPNTKINIINGNSIKTLKKFILDNPKETKSYDLIHLDGGHERHVYSQDYANSKKLLIDNGIVVFDDYDMPYIRSFINEKCKRNEIIEYNDINIKRTNRHFIYKYL